MKIAVVLNGVSLSKRKFYNKYLPLLQRDHQIEVFETRTAHDAISLAAEIVVKKHDLIIAAGGDGTINQVLNGMFSDRSLASHLPVLAILPLGSGNDFVRTLKRKNTPIEFSSSVNEFKTGLIDIGELTYSTDPSPHMKTSLEGKRYFLNVVDVGMGPTVVRGVLKSGRTLGSSLAYYQSIIKTFFTYKPVLLRAVSEEWQWQGKMRSFAIGNGKYYGNGLCIAPDAVIDDGLLNVFACGDVSVFDFIIQSIPLKQGKKIRHAEVSYFTTKEVELTADSPLEIEADGEIVGWLPAQVKPSSVKIRILL